MTFTTNWARFGDLERNIRERNTRGIARERNIRGVTYAVCYASVALAVVYIYNLCMYSLSIYIYNIAYICSV